MEATKDLEKYTYDLLEERGVTLEDIAELVLYVQKPYMSMWHPCFQNERYTMR